MSETPVRATFNEWVKKNNLTEKLTTNREWFLAKRAFIANDAYIDWLEMELNNQNDKFLEYMADRADSNYTKIKSLYDRLNGGLEKKLAAATEEIKDLTAVVEMLSRENEEYSGQAKEDEIKIDSATEVIRFYGDWDISPCGNTPTIFKRNEEGNYMSAEELGAKARKWLEESDNS